ncbi:MAG TPA: amidohydrolase family protein [Pyrinomonadaceae bacterium]|jgi:imidazolonepropionase-like amidohydrolase|nr:amidohydrolase family protein [Pyrinomonadaceae bacterium]
MKYFKAVFAPAFLLIFACFVSAQIIAIKAGKLVDPENGTTAVNQIILVEKGKITAAGAGLAIPAGATVIDLSNATVLPGLFDAHSHLCYTTVPGNRNQFHLDMEQTTAYRAILGVRNAKEMLEAGFTTVRDVGNNGRYADTALRQSIEQGMVPGPTMINAGRIIAPFGGQYRIQPDRPELAFPEYFFADTRDEMKKAIRENIQFGALVIKIVVDDQKYIYTADDIKFMVDEAHRAGLKLAAHCMTEQGARNAIEGGVDSIEHGFQMSDQALEMAKGRGVVLVGTDFTLHAAELLGQGSEFAKFFHGVFLDRLKRAHKVGVTMAFGTDAFFDDPGQTRGSIAVSYIDSFTEAGIPNKDILKIMTTNAAKLLGVDQQRGAIKAGQAADIIATAENPLDNINALKKVSFVMKNGVVYKR